MASIAMDLVRHRRSGGIAWRADWPVVAGLAFLVLLVRGGWFGNPVADIDEQLYSFIGWRMLHGELPFVDWWDRKPFGLFAIFAVSHWLGGPGALAYQLPAALATLAGALLTYTLAKPLADRAGAAIAGAFYVMLLSAYSSYSGQSETFHVPLILAMVLLVRDPIAPDASRRALLAMALGGLALQIKYTVLPQCLFLGAWALWTEFRRGADALRLASMAVAFAVLGTAPTMAVGLFYLAIGEFDAFHYANFVSFFERGGMPTGRFDPANWLWLMPLAVLIAGGLYSACRVAPPRDVRLYLFYAAWFASALATVLLPKSIYMYYLAALVPGAALLATPLFDRRSVLGMAPAVLLLAAAVHILALPDRNEASQQERLAVTRFAAAIAPYVDSAGQCLYVFDGPTALYRLTGGCAPTRFVYPDHLTNVLETPALGVSQAGEVARVLATRPAAIVTTTTPTQPQNPTSLLLVQRAIRQNYEGLAKIRIGQQDFVAWTLRDRGQGTAASRSRARPMRRRYNPAPMMTAAPSSAIASGISQKPSQPSSTAASSWP